MSIMDIYDRYARMYPTFAEKTTGWSSIGLDEIEVMLTDRTRIIYDDIEQVLIFPNRGELSDKEVWAREFGRRLRKRLYFRGISQAEVAKHCGVSQPTVSKWLTGKTIPDVYKLTTLAELLGCTSADIIEYEY